MPKYQNGKIYTIRCRTDDSLIYVGSTTQRLCSRLTGHKADSLKTHIYSNHSLYSIIGDWGNWYIELYENFPCETKEELNKREGEIIRLIGTLNKQIAGRTRKEWRQENAELIKEKKKIYQQQHQEEIKEKGKIYREANRDALNEKKKEYYYKNKATILEKNKEKTMCDCGAYIVCKSRHLKSNKHLKLVNLT